ncbi:MAG: hypothetical protein ACR2PG_27585 [Hyphomicrobiaceae bacterium]
MTSNSKFVAVLIAVAATSTVSLQTMTSVANAQADSYYESGSRMPDRGFEGFDGFGLDKEYCSFRREPIRRCKRRRGGRRSCRVVRWRVVEICN